MRRSISRNCTPTLESSGILVLDCDAVPIFSLWSHHEKSVVIDQRVAYVGGVDLCYGRFDNDQYWLKEPNDEGAACLKQKLCFQGPITTTLE